MAHHRSCESTPSLRWPARASRRPAGSREFRAFLTAMSLILYCGGRSKSSASKSGCRRSGCKSGAPGGRPPAGSEGHSPGQAAPTGPPDSEIGSAIRLPGSQRPVAAYRPSPRFFLIDFPTGMQYSSNCYISKWGPNRSVNGTRTGKQAPFPANLRGAGPWHRGGVLAADDRVHQRGFRCIP